jgi:hypothetical protein
VEWDYLVTIRLRKVCGRPLHARKNEDYFDDDLYFTEEMKFRHDKEKVNNNILQNQTTHFE